MAQFENIRETLTLKKEEEALIHHMKQHAVKQCKEQQKAYAECVRGRTVSVVWACRASAAAMSECLSHFTDATVLEALKSKWLKAGKPNLANSLDF